MIKKYEAAVKIAADSIVKLRKCDVERVLEWAPKELRKGLAEYITERRPDLATEVSEVMEEL